MVVIWYERHAQTHDNVAGVASGYRDVALTDLGREQARGVMAKRYAGVHFDAVFTPDRQRAYETAQLIFEGRGIPVMQDTRLRACDYGDLEGRPRAEMSAARVNAVNEPFPNGESYDQVAQRVLSFLEELAVLHDGKQVMIVGTGGTLPVLQHLINGIPLSEALGSPLGERPWILKYEPQQLARQ